jgi:LPS O-antigen subunit length determinant protein (WzzB/FepE family)
LAILEDQLNKYYQKSIQPLEIKEELVSLKAHNGMLQQFKERFQKLEFLGNITPIVVYQHFEKVIEQASVTQVYELDQPSIDLFSRLKLTSMKQRLDKV